MKLDNRFVDAPKQGILYLSTRKKIIIKRYTDLESTKEEIKKEPLEDILEIHLFDQESEYRLIRSLKAPDGIESRVSDNIVSSSNEDSFVWEEEIFTDLPQNRAVPEDDIPKVAIVNYLKYDDNDLLEVINYRLKEV